MFKSNKTRILACIVFVLLAGLVGLFLYRIQGRTDSLDLGLEAQLTQLRWEGENGKVLNLKKEGKKWRLVSTENFEEIEIEANEQRVSDLLQVIRSWDIREMVATTPKGKRGVLKVYGSGFLAIERCLQKYQWIQTDSSLYIQASSSQYYKMYLPGADPDWSYLFTLEKRDWTHQWICDYYYYDLQRVLVSVENNISDYTIDTSKRGQELPSSASALSAFKSVYFDRYLHQAELDNIEDLLKNKPLHCFEIWSREGEYTHLLTYPKKESFCIDSTGEGMSSDLFQLYAILERTRLGRKRKDTVVVSYVLIDRMLSSIQMLSSTQP